MAWITPKTDWSSHYDADGNYEGDFFNYADYNRIKNNLAFLAELASEYTLVPPIPLGVDKHAIDPLHPDVDNDNFFADEINQIEDGLDTIARLVPYIYVGSKRTYTENGRFIDAAELNRIESAELRLRDWLEKSVGDKMRLEIRFGLRPRDIKP